MKLYRDLRVTHDDSETLKRSTTADPSSLLETRRNHIAGKMVLPLLFPSYPRILCCTCSGTSLPPSLGTRRRSCRDLAGRGCCHIHLRCCHTNCHRRSPAGLAHGCWHRACGYSPPGLWPRLSALLHYKKKEKKIPQPVWIQHFHTKYIKYWYSVCSLNNDTCIVMMYFKHIVLFTHSLEHFNNLSWNFLSW